jgi:hypothetical protein
MWNWKNRKNSRKSEEEIQGYDFGEVVEKIDGDQI